MAQSGFRPVGPITLNVSPVAGIDLTPLVNAAAKKFMASHVSRVLAGKGVDEKPLPITKRQRDPALSRRYGNGPPLAPKRHGSRVIRNATAAAFRRGNGLYVVELSVPSFTSKGGKDILPMHARPGSGVRYPKRDVISGPSPADRREFAEDLRRFVASGDLPPGGGGGAGAAGGNVRPASQKGAGRWPGVGAWMRGMVRRMFGG